MHADTTGLSWPLSSSLTLSHGNLTRVFDVQAVLLERQRAQD